MTLVPFAEHLARVLGSAEQLPARTVALGEAGGLVLATDVISPVALPGFDNSAMDGFAVRRADVLDATAEWPVRLRVVGDIPAGSGANPPLAPGECARIMTGSPVPTDADAVVPFEATGRGTDVAESPAREVDVLVPPKPGAHIRRAGEDAPAGSLVAAAGTVLAARSLAGIAAVGVADVSVVPRARVAVITTGDELVTPGSALAPGQLFDSNTTLVTQLVHEAGGEVTAQFRAGDGGEEFASALAQAAKLADVIVTTGGVSVGAFDVVRLQLDTDSGVRFDRVAMQPGKPQGFGRLPSGALVFALPGNPVSVFTSFEALVRPTLRILSGLPAEPTQREAIAAEGWRTPPGRQQFMPVRFTETGEIRRATAGGSGSHLVSRLAAAEALAVVPAEVDQVRVGDRLKIWEILP